MAAGTPLLELWMEISLLTCQAKPLARRLACEPITCSTTRTHSISATTSARVIAQTWSSPHDSVAALDLSVAAVAVEAVLAVVAAAAGVYCCQIADRIAKAPITRSVWAKHGSSAQRWF